MFTSSVAIAMSLHLFSVYVYEPTWRRRRVYIRYLRSSEDIDHLKETYLKNGAWKLLDEPHANGLPVEIPGLSMQRKDKPKQSERDHHASEAGAAALAPAQFLRRAAARWAPAQLLGRAAAHWAPGAMPHGGAQSEAGPPPTETMPVSMSDGLEDGADRRDSTPSYPSEERPVVVQLTRGDLGKLDSCLLQLADKVFSVDRGWPLDVTLEHAPELPRPALLRFWSRSKAIVDAEVPLDSE